VSRRNARAIIIRIKLTRQSLALPEGRDQPPSPGKGRREKPENFSGEHNGQDARGPTGKMPVLLPIGGNKRSKQAREDVADKVDYEMANHVGHEIAPPKIEESKNGTEH
jgi:hypothetical protein